MQLRSPFAMLVLAMSLLGCSGTTPVPGGGSAGTDQTPPTRGADMDAWVNEGAYKAWKCEPGAHNARSPSPHGVNRICSNDAIASFSGSGERPEGSAAVKEIYDKVGGNVTGIAVYLKTKPTSEGGNNWYWYERLGTRVVADGLGVSGCAGCHSGAGAVDQVFTAVK